MSVSERSLSPQRPALRWLIIALLILLLAFGLRIFRLANNSVWWDEGFSYWISSLSLPDLFFETSIDTHPPLYYLLLHGWMRLTGQTEFALRMLAVFAGVFEVAAAYRLSADLGGERAGAFAALLTAFARLQVAGSQEIRQHILLAPFALSAILVAFRLLRDGSHRWRYALLLTLLTAGGLLTVYIFAAAVIALNLGFVVAWLLSERRWRLAFTWIVSQVGALVIFVPWMLYATSQVPMSEARPGINAWFLLRMYISSIFLGYAIDLDRLAPLLIGLLLLLIAAAVLTIRSGRSRISAWVMLVSGVLLPPILIFILYALPRAQRFNSLTPSPRYFHVLAGASYVLVGWGLSRLKGRWRWLAGGLMVGLVGLSAWSLSGHYASRHLSDNFKSSVAVVEALREPDDTVLLFDDRDWPVFVYHYGSLPEYKISNAQPVRDEADANQRVQEIIDEYAGVWVIQNRNSEVTDPHNLIIQQLQHQALETRRYASPDIQLWFFAFDADRADPVMAQRALHWPAAFKTAVAPIAPGLNLAGYYQPEPEVWAGGLFTVGVGWHSTAQADGEWWSALKVLDAAGNELSSSLFMINAYATQSDYYAPVQVYIPPDAPPGRTQLVFAAGDTWQPLGTFRVRSRGAIVETVELPADAQEVNARFGESIDLHAVSLPDQTTWQAGDQIPLTFYWSVEELIHERYKVFVHIVGDQVNPQTSNHVWGQQDQEPRNGLAPTTSWLPGSLIADDYLVPIAADAPAGAYQLQVGLYLPLEGRRLPASDPAGQPLGDTVTILEIEIP